MAADAARTRSDVRGLLFDLPELPADELAERGEPGAAGLLLDVAHALGLDHVFAPPLAV